ncbi:MAG: hypothetical protein WC464_08085 [Bdellovibrionales bacterium]
MHLSPFLAVVMLSVAVLSSHPAQAALVGSPCTQSGQTRMDTDNVNIIACVCKSTANCGPSGLEWKTMSSGTLSCPAGQGLTGIVNGIPQCAPLGVINYTCPGGGAATSIVNGQPQCAPKGVINYSCPSGQYIASISNGTANCFSVPPVTCCGTIEYWACRGRAYSYTCLVNGRANLNP